MLNCVDFSMRSFKIGVKETSVLTLICVWLSEHLSESVSHHFLTSKCMWQTSQEMKGQHMCIIYRQHCLNEVASKCSFNWSWVKKLFSELCLKLGLINYLDPDISCVYPSYHHLPTSYSSYFYLFLFLWYGKSGKHWFEGLKNYFHLPIVLSMKCKR